MALSEQEEFELLALRRKRAMASKTAAPEKSSGNGFMGALKTIQNNPANLASPVELLNTSDQSLSFGAEKAGEFTEGQFKKHGVNPTVAKGVRTAMGLTPAAATIVGDPQLAIEKVPIKPAVNWMRRALGFRAIDLPSSYARGQAANAAREAFKEGVMPFSGNSQKAFDRAAALEAKTGSKLGHIRESVGPQPTDRVLSRLEDLRNQLTEGGARGGKWNAVHRKIDEAKATIEGLFEGNKNQPIYEAVVPEVESGTTLPVKFGAKIGEAAPEALETRKIDRIGVNSIEKAKKREGGSLNWVKSQNAQDDAKGVTNAIEAGVEDILKENGVDVNQYRMLKKKYGMAKHMQRGLNRELAAQQGNNAVSLRGAGVASGALAHGNPIPAMAALGIWETGVRRGAAIAAHGLNAIGNIPKTAQQFSPNISAATAIALQRLGKLRDRNKGGKK